MKDGVCGKHVYGSFYDVEEERIYHDEKYARDIVVKAVENAKAKLVDVKSWKMEGKDGGISVLVLANESHVAIHSWKEYRYITIDIYTYRHIDPWKIWQFLKEVLKPKKYTVNYSDRFSSFLK